MVHAPIPADYGSSKDGEPARPLHQPKITCFTLTLAFLSAIGGFLFGYDTGVVSGVLILLKEKFNMSYNVEEVFVSITMGAAMLFALVGGVTTDILGRKTTILIASMVFVVGSVVLAAAHDIATLLVGRFIIGIGIGLSSMTTPMYIAECSPRPLRGRLVTMYSLFLTMGILIAAIISGLFSKNKEHGFRYVLGLAAVPAFIQFVFFLFMPESPRWLVSKNRMEEARACLEKVEGVKEGVVDKGVVDDELADILKSVEENKEYERKGFIGTLAQVMATPHVRRALAIGAYLQLVQQITAINTIMYYGATIIQMSGVEDPETAIWLAVVVAIVNFLSTFIGIYVVDRCGRRLLTLVSLFGTMIGLLVLGSGFLLASINSPPVSLNVSASDICSSYSTCGECVGKYECSYCFQPNDHDYSNSFCFPKEFREKNPDFTGDNSTSEYLTSTLNKHKQCRDIFNVTQFATTSNNFVDDHWGVTTQYCHAPFSWIAIVGMVLYLLFYAPGMGPNPWTINSEIYPSWARSTCVSVATSVNWLSNMIVSLTFLTLMRAITFYGAFYFYAGLVLISFVILFLILPETKNKRLEEIEELFKGDLIVAGLYNENKCAYSWFL